MACIPYVQWLQYNSACKAKTSTLDVKGFGYTRTGIAGLRGLQGLGDISFSVTPASIANAVQSGQLVTTAPAPPSSVTSSSINTTPVYNDPNDPCYLASQEPCPASTACPASCPSGWHSIDMIHAPGTPVTCGCGRNPSASAPNAPVNITSSSSATAPASNPGGGVTATMVPQTSTAGFSHWGLLAALAVGGGALYLVMKKKSAS